MLRLSRAPLMMLAKVWNHHPKPMVSNKQLMGPVYIPDMLCLIPTHDKYVFKLDSVVNI